MQAFNVSASLDNLTETYPSAKTLLQAAEDCDQDGRYAMARLWLSEGIPFAFRDRPAVYEALRIWLARRLAISAKEVTLIGSGRQGISLQNNNPGRPFGAHSDLDLSLISSNLFQRTIEVFRRWITDYDQGTVAPRGERERTLWDSNKRQCPPGIARGFIDPHKIPTWNRYPEAQQIIQYLFLAHEKLKLTAGAPTVRKITARVYRDWDCFVRQTAINLETCARFQSQT